MLLGGCGRDTWPLRQCCGPTQRLLLAALQLAAARRPLSESAMQMAASRSQVGVHSRMSCTRDNVHQLAACISQLHAGFALVVHMRRAQKAGAALAAKWQGRYAVTMLSATSHFRQRTIHIRPGALPQQSSSMRCRASHGPLGGACGSRQCRVRRHGHRRECRCRPCKGETHTLCKYADCSHSRAAACSSTTICNDLPVHVSL
jgi:hypothetical protein